MYVLVHVEEDVSCGLPSLADIFLSQLTNMAVIEALPNTLLHTVDIADVMPYIHVNEVAHV